MTSAITGIPGKDGEEDQEEILRWLFLCCWQKIPGLVWLVVFQRELETLAPVKTGWFFRHILGVAHQKKTKWWKRQNVEHHLQTLGRRHEDRSIRWNTWTDKIQSRSGRMFRITAASLWQRNFSEARRRSQESCWRFAATRKWPMDDHTNNPANKVPRAAARL